MLPALSYIGISCDIAFASAGIFPPTTPFDVRIPPIAVPIGICNGPGIPDKSTSPVASFAGYANTYWPSVFVI